MLDFVYWGVAPNEDRGLKMEATNEAIIWAASIQAAAAIHSADIRKSNTVDRARLLMNEATHYYHAAMDYFPMRGSPDWWSGPRPMNKVGSGES